MRRWALWALLAVLIFAFGGMGCGVVHTGTIMSANRAFTEARLAGAEKHAPYEFYRAREFLAKAREEAGFSDFQTSVRYARIAKDAADAALKKSRIHKSDDAEHGE